MKGDYSNFVAAEEHDPVYRVKRVSNFISDGAGGLVRELTSDMAIRLAQVGDVYYVGKAAVASAEGDAVWQVRKIDATTGVSVTWADGDTEYDNVWTNYASLSYL